MLSMGHAQLTLITNEYREVMGGKLNISAVYLPYIEECLLYLCIIYKVCIAISMGGMG